MSFRRRIRLATAVMAAALLLLCLGSSQAAAGWRTTTAFGKSDAVLTDVATIPLGVISAGTVSRGLGECSFAITSHRLNGSVDRSFGTRGKRLVGFGTGPGECAAADEVAVDREGRIYVAGDVFSRPASGQPVLRGTAIARLTPDGSLDPSFSGDGLALIPGISCCAGLALQAGERPILGTFDEDTSRLSIARLSLDGSLDPSFGGGDGTAEGPALGGESYGVDLAVREDYRIVAAGVQMASRDCGGDEDEGCREKFAVAQWSPDGEVDTSFGNGGGVTTGVGFRRPGQDEAIADSLAIKRDGRIVVGGDAWVHGCGGDGCDGTNPDIDFAVARYAADGKLDRRFGNHGTVLTDVERGRAGVADRGEGGVVLTGQDGFVLAGYSGAPELRFTLVAYRRGGGLDRSFGKRGILRARPAGFASAATRVAGDRIVVGGEVSIDRRPAGRDSVFALGAYGMP